MLPRFLQDSLDRRTIERWAPHPEVWKELLPRVPLLRGLDTAEAEALRTTTGLILGRKDIHGAQGQEVSDAMRLMIAVQAALPVLNLGLDWYRNWSSIIVYPGEFTTRHVWMDNAGVVHEQERSLVGEAIHGGPVVLSWQDSRDDLDPEAEGNVVIHEFAHKLDMLNGNDINGFPPLHRGMPTEPWTRAFSSAYADLSLRVEQGDPTAIDPYAAYDEGEFFAVCMETFFVDPLTLRSSYPGVYEQLRQWLRQDPAARGERAMPLPSG
ncbi:MAG: zinc-dependent peptidase [Gammaproteobacteria bacterium]